MREAGAGNDEMGWIGMRDRQTKTSALRGNVEVDFITKPECFDLLRQTQACCNGLLGKLVG